MFSLLLGDGNLHNSPRDNTGRLTITHGLQQADYIAWKAKLVSELFNREVRVRAHNSGASAQFSIAAKKLRVWKRFAYPGGKKDLAAVIKQIRHPEMALAIWLMDDGYVEPSLDKKYPGKCYSASLRIFTCDQSIETQNKLAAWFESYFGCIPKVATQFNRRQNVRYPFLKFKADDSMKIWQKLRDVILEHKSMRHKFRYIEQVFNERLVQPTPLSRWQHHLKKI